MRYLKKIFVYSILTVCGIAASLTAQTGINIESRIQELERRIQVLEKYSGIAESGKKQDAGNSPAYSAAKSPESQTQYPVAVELVEKEFLEAGPGEESDRLGFQFEFRNSGNTHITSFSGEIILIDSGSEELRIIDFDIAKYLSVGDKTMWFSSIPFQNTDVSCRKLFTADIAQIGVKLRLKQVMYFDTRIEKF